MVRVVWWAAGLFLLSLAGHWIAYFFAAAGPGAPSRTGEAAGRAIMSVGTTFVPWLLIALLVSLMARGVARGGGWWWLGAYVVLVVLPDLAWSSVTPILSSLSDRGMFDEFGKVHVLGYLTLIPLHAAPLLVVSLASAHAAGVCRSRRTATDAVAAGGWIALTAACASITCLAYQWNAVVFRRSMAPAYALSATMLVPVWIWLVFRCRRAALGAAAGTPILRIPVGPNGPKLAAEIEEPHPRDDQRGGLPAPAIGTLEWLRCPGCDYSLIGLPEPKCPECGTQTWLAPDPARSSTGWRGTMASAAAVWCAFSVLIILGAFGDFLTAGHVHHVISGIERCFEQAGRLLLVAGLTWAHFARVLRGKGPVWLLLCLGVLALGPLVQTAMWVLVIGGAPGIDGLLQAGRITPLLATGLAVFLTGLGVPSERPTRSTKLELVAATIALLGLTCTVCGFAWWAQGLPPLVTPPAILSRLVPLGAWLWLLWRLRRTPNL